MTTYHAPLQNAFCLTQVTVMFITPGCCRVCELLQSGAVMSKSYQPHEGHIPYLLQFFMDYNLYGMNLVNLGAVKFRRSQSKGKGYYLTYLCLPSISPVELA